MHWPVPVRVSHRSIPVDPALLPGDARTGQGGGILLSKPGTAGKERS